MTDSRWGHVNVKSLALQPDVLAKRRALRAGAADAIFIRDGHVVGEGKPGPIARRLADAFRRATRG